MRLADKEMADWRKAEEYIEAIMLLFLSNTNISDEKRDIAFACFDRNYRQSCCVGL